MAVLVTAPLLDSEDAVDMIDTEDARETADELGERVVDDVKEVS